MKKPQLLTRKIAASLVCLALLSFTGSALADNTGSGGTITYTDSNGFNAVALPPYVGGYVVHTFTANGTLTIPSSTNADVLVVAGGGGGGGSYGCGGGAGGLVFSNLSLVGGSNYSVTIGAGGAGYTGGSATTANNGANGVDSVFSTLTALGGGGGGGGYDTGSPGGQAGGSGGGGHSTAGAGAATQPSSASGGFGNAGFSYSPVNAFGGGGGAGAAATDSAGGIGKQYSIRYGTNVYYAGGGGGISAGGTGGGLGGSGGGGNGGTGDHSPGIAGAANTGGGGGGGFNANGAAGGAGIVIVRYAYDPGAPTVALNSPTNGQAFVGGSSISATASALGGMAPYSVTYYYKLTTAGSYTATAAVGPFGATNTFAQTLGTLSDGVYEIYATVTDSAAGTATSVTNTFTVYSAGNTGLGGTITYVDSNGLNPVYGPAYVGGYVVQTFTTNGTLTLPYSISVDALVVAGGGGGGGTYGGGGGAGGLVYSNLSLNAGSISVTIGAGGAGTGANTYGANGANSVFSTLTALGGGGGGIGYLGPVAGQNGGSGGGGGGASPYPPGGTATQPSSASGGYGNNGGSGPDNSSYGGGGGAGAAGGIVNGGDGLQYAISGVTNYYAGGGGGITTGTGGQGGGGYFGGNPGGANTGGGGGGGFGGNGGNGGNGIVIVRYPYSANPPVSVTVSSPTSGQQFLLGSSISATALVAGGTTPFSVTYHYKLTTAGSYTATAAVGPFSATSTFTQTLGTLPVGAYQLYATVVDNVSGTATSATNTFTVFSTGNTGTGGTVVYTDSNGLNPVSSPPYVGGYVVQTFTANGTLVLPSTVTANVLVVAGGGGGGGLYGDGGGAGGLIYTNLSLGAGTYGATVGAGGLGSGYNTNGANGNNSVLGTLIALGGGGGGAGYLGNAPGQNGGSGGGGGGGDIGGFDAGTATQPASASGGYGNNGYTPGDGSLHGGGGGAGVAPTSEAGGDGLQYAISGLTNYYAGGGGGGNGVGIGGQGGGGTGGAAPGPSAGGNGIANTGGGGGGGLNRQGGTGGSGIIIVQYPYAASSTLSVAVTSPTGRSFLYGSSVPATAFVAGGTAPYSVTYHYKLTTAGSYTATASVGPSYTPSTFAQTLGAFSVVGTYQVYATVTDGTASTATSVTNTFTVSLTAGIAVQDANFETPGVLSSVSFWSHVADVWNPGNTGGPGGSFQQNSYILSPQDAFVQFTHTCPGGVDWFLLLNTNTLSITQDLLTSVNAGDTISLTFYGGHSQPANAVDGGVFTAAFLVGSTPYSMSVDTTVLETNSWQSCTLTQVIANSGELSLKFNWVSGDPWLDNISVTRTIPLPGSVPPVLGAPKASGGNLIVTGAGGTPNAGYTWLSTTNLSAPITWTTNSTGTLDGTGAFSNSIPIGTNPASFFRLRLP